MIMGLSKLCRLPPLVFLCIALVPITWSCKLRDQAKSKSFVGLNADIDQQIANGKSPSFVLLQQWFSGALPVDKTKAQQGSIRYKVHVDFDQEVWRRMPPSYKSGLVKYLQQQLIRIADFQRNAKNKDRLRLLLELEAREMRDILMAIIRIDHTPMTNDAFAHLLSKRNLRNYVDRYSIDLLEKLSVRSNRSLISNLSKEEQNFAQILIDTYLTPAGANEKFLLNLQNTCGKVLGMLNALSQKPKESCDSGEASLLFDSHDLKTASASLDGNNKKYLNFYGGLTAVGGAGDVKDGLTSPPRLSIFGGRDLQAGAKSRPSDDSPDSSDGKPDTKPDSKPDSGSDSTPDGSAPDAIPDATPDSTPDGSPDISPDSSPDASPTPKGLSGLLALIEQLLNKLLGMGWDKSIPDSTDPTLSSGLLLSDQLNNDDLPPEPSFDCYSEGFRGLDLVLCQRYYSVLPNMKKSSGYSPFTLDNESETKDGFNIEGGVGYNFWIVANHFSGVQNQGREGACSAYGFAHTAEATLRAMGVKTSISAAQLWNEQGRQPYNDASIAAAKRKNFAGKRLASSRTIRSIADMKSTLDKGRALYIGSIVGADWLRPSGAMSCGTPGSPAGHAYSLHGYDDSKQLFIVKNSWGDGWGEQGYHYLPFRCLNQSSFILAGPYDLVFQ
jgi:hypothetical protein